MTEIVRPEDIDPLWLLERIAQGPGRSLGVEQDAEVLIY
jgi:hypothetical protein